MVNTVKHQVVVGRTLTDGQVDKYILFSVVTRGYMVDRLEMLWDMAKEGKVINCVAYESKGKKLVRGTRGVRISKMRVFTMEKYLKLKKKEGGKNEIVEDRFREHGVFNQRRGN